MQSKQIDHLNPSRLKIPYYLCNPKKQLSSKTNPSQMFQDQYLSRNTYVNSYDELSDQNTSLRRQLQQLKKYNTSLRRKLQNKQKELQQSDRQFKQTLVNYNKRLQLSNNEMASILMEQSRDYYKQIQRQKERDKQRERQKSRSKSKNKLIAIKKQLMKIDCSQINKICYKSKISPRR